MTTASKPGNKVMFIYRDTLDNVCKARYDEKLHYIEGKDPYTMSKEDWSCNPEADIQEMDIAKYLIHTVSAYTFDELRGRKSLEAYNYFVSGWVQDIKHAAIGERCVLTARVRHAQRTTDPFLVPWLIAEKSGSVICGHCTCIAGLGEVCSHVSALLFAIEAAVKMRNSKTVTQEKAYWLLPSATQKVLFTVYIICVLNPCIIRSIKLQCLNKQIQPETHLQDASSRCHIDGSHAIARRLISAHSLLYSTYSLIL